MTQIPREDLPFKTPPLAPPRRLPSSERRAQIVSRAVAGEHPNALAREYGITASGIRHLLKTRGLRSGWHLPGTPHFTPRTVRRLRALIRQADALMHTKDYKFVELAHRMESLVRELAALRDLA